MSDYISPVIINGTLTTVIVDENYPILWNVATAHPDFPILMVWAKDKQEARFKAGVKLQTGYYSNFRCIEA